MRTSKLWLLGPPFALLISAIVYYVRFQGFRDWTNENIPWVRENIAPKLPGLRSASEAPHLSNPAPVAEIPNLHPRLPPHVPAAQQPESIPTPATPADLQKKSYVLKDGSVDLRELESTPADWPKVLALKKPTQFPAVRDGQVIGTLTAPAGTTVRLVKIQQGKVGVEYKGGGSWLPPEGTDLAERLN